MGMAIAIPRFTVGDLEHFPRDGNRYELLDGLLLVTPAPSRVHQIVATRLAGRLFVALAMPGHAHVVAPGAVVRLPNTQLEPDVLVTPSRFPPSLEWADVTEHWLAVEVFSRGSRIYDRDFKRDAYLALGVQQVWLVDCEDRSVEVCRARGSGEIARDTIRWAVPSANVIVSVDLGEIFAGVD